MSSAWLGLAGPGRAGPASAGLGWTELAGLAWDVMGLQSTVENPNKISP